MGRSELKELSEQEFAQIVKNQAVYKLRGGGLMISTSSAPKKDIYKAVDYYHHLQI